MAAKPQNNETLASAVEAIAGCPVRDAERLRRALTHASARGAHAGDYQRLEFLGDRVLGLVVAQMVFDANPKAAEGELSVRLNALVNAETLAEIADEAGISELIQAGSEIRSLSARKRINLRADVMEAVIAVVYLEGGLEAARGFIRRYWEGRSKAETAARRDAKTELQEWAHQMSKAVPVYSVDKREGPDHDPVYTVSAIVDGFEAGVGIGRSKREAEQAAATDILVREGVWQEEENTQ